MGKKRKHAFALITFPSLAYLIFACEHRVPCASQTLWYILIWENKQGTLLLFLYVFLNRFSPNHNYLQLFFQFLIYVHFFIIHIYLAVSGFLFIYLLWSLFAAHLKESPSFLCQHSGYGLCPSDFACVQSRGVEVKSYTSRICFPTLFASFYKKTSVSTLNPNFIRFVLQENNSLIAG